MIFFYSKEGEYEQAILMGTKALELGMHFHMKSSNTNIYKTTSWALVDSCNNTWDPKEPHG